MGKEKQNFPSFKKILWLTVPAFSYVSENAESSLIDVRYVYKQCFDINLKIKTIIFILFSYIKIDWLFWGSWKNEIDMYDAIIVRDGMPTYIVNSIHKRWPDKKIIVYFGNIIRDSSQKQYLEFAKGITKYIFTFDYGDSQHYLIEYARMPFTYEVTRSKNQNESVYFFGRDKGRKTQINEIKNVLEQQGISVDFTIVENESQFQTYQEIFDRTSQSKAILEITEIRQNSFSLRVLEALFLQKKIITNNLEIKNTNFYMPNNIFIIGFDDVNLIKEWYNIPYQKIPDEIMYQYSLDCFGGKILKTLH